jgi:HD superfamily phosphohydrolase
MQFTGREDAWIKPFIASANFQRLRHIKQMGMTDLIFPGAVHTRFNHSLGCCYVANQIATKIHLTDEERQLVILACLLHDIGHGPFSHAFEGIFTRNPIRHEDWTPYFLAEYHSPLFIAEFNKNNPDFPLTSVILDRIQAMIMHKEKTNKLLADIVSSQLDADRLDYLLRDSHFCGLSYGEYDFRWLLHVLKRVEAEGVERLGISHKGIGVVEQYLMARRLMMRNINNHPKKQAAESLFVRLLQKLAQSIEEDPLFATIKTSDLGQFFIHVSHYNTGKQSKEEFLSENYALYKNLYDYDVWLLIRYLTTLSSSHDVVVMAQRIQTRSIPKAYRLTADQMLRAPACIDTILKKYPGCVRDWQLFLIETRYHSYHTQADPIWVDDGGNIISLNTLSQVINAVSDNPETGGFVIVDLALVGSDIEKALFAMIAQDVVCIQA